MRADLARTAKARPCTLAATCRRCQGAAMFTDGKVGPSPLRWTILLRTHAAPARCSTGRSGRLDTVPCQRAGARQKSGVSLPGKGHPTGYAEQQARVSRRRSGGEGSVCASGAVQSGFAGPLLLGEHLSDHPGIGESSGCSSPILPGQRHLFLYRQPGLSQTKARGVRRPGGLARRCPRPPGRFRLNSAGRALARSSRADATHPRGPCSARRSSSRGTTSGSGSPFRRRLR